jgi:hypothetical protein
MSTSFFKLSKFKQYTPTPANSSEAKPGDQFMDRYANIRTEAANYLDSASTDFQDALC